MASREHEDNLLNTRTGIFLAINTLLINAISGDGFIVPVAVEVLGIVISVAWMRVALFNRKAILQAHGISTFGKIFNPTDILALWLPTIFILFWLVVLVNAINKIIW